MRPLAFVLLVSSVCFPWSAVAADREARAASLKLEKLDVRVGLSEAEFDRVIRAHLPELAQCVAFAHWTKTGLVKVTEPEKEDDRVEVTLARNPYFGDSEAFGDNQQPFKVTTEGALSDTDCVRWLVASWPWPQKQVEAARRAHWKDPLTSDATPLVKFLYRFRPTLAQREEAKRANQASLDVLCNTKVEGDLPRHVEAVIGRMSGPVRSGLAGTFLAVAHAHAAPNDRATILARAVRELAEQYDLKTDCAATRGLLPLSTQEYLSQPGLPKKSCAERVKQLEEIAAKPLGFGVPRLFSSRAKPMSEPGDVFDFEADRYIPASDVSARAAAAAKAQQRKRPIGYVLLRSEFAYPDDVVSFAARLGSSFDLRLIVWRESPKASSYTSTAWPQVVTLLREQISKSEQVETIPHFVAALERDQDPNCAALVQSGLDKITQLDVLVRTVATGLEACGCPQPYAELTWARLAVLLDNQVDHAGWVPLNVTKDPKAPELKIEGTGGLQKLVDALPLQDKPMRVVFSSGY